MFAHRKAWLDAGRELPEGKDLHHACPGGPNTLCTNVDHLRLVTPAEHSQVHLPEIRRAGKRKRLSRCPKCGGPRRWLAHRKVPRSICDHCDREASRASMARHRGADRPLHHLLVVERRVRRRVTYCEKHGTPRRWLAHLKVPRSICDECARERSRKWDRRQRKRGDFVTAENWGTYARTRVKPSASRSARTL